MRYDAFIEAICRGVITWIAYLTIDMISILHLYM